jgi:hypothetical protein
MNFFKAGRFSLRTRALAVTALLALTFGLSGCFEVKQDTPSQTLIGTIQGKLTDSVTLQPIVGASIDIGAAKVTTDAEGKYIITNIVIPVDSTNNIKAATYKVTIDMRNVGVTPRYPDFSYDLVSILFTSGTSPATTTPVSYLKENVDFTVGKLAANISGVVADKFTLQPVAAGYTVQLVSLGSTIAGSTAINETIAGSTNTDASGNFAFANIESLRNFRIDAWNSARTITGTQTVIAPDDGATKTLSVQAKNAVLVESNDTRAPVIVSVTPEMNADIAPAATDVIYTFSKPILQTANTSTSPSVTTGLYNKVDVKFNGSKASNIAHGLAWNTSFTQLTVSIPTLAASSKYSVDLTPANALLTDSNGTTLDNTVDRRLLSFTTNGSALPSAPAAVTVVNSASLNYNSTTVVLDWLPVSGAKGYNVYRAQNYPSAAGQFQLVGSSVPSTLTSDFSDTLPATFFVTGQNKLTYTYAVTSVSADNIESANSPSVTAQDAVVPTATLPSGLASTYTITFTEPMDEISATTLSHYILTEGSAGAGNVPAIVKAVLNPGLTTVTLTLSAAAVTGNVLAVTGVTDIAGNVMLAPTPKTLP